MSTVWDKLALLQLHKAGLPIGLKNIAKTFGIDNFKYMRKSIGYTRKDIERIASELNCVAIYAREDELLLDLDEPFEYAVVKLGSYLHTSKVSKTIFETGIFFDTPHLFTISKSGNAHLYIKLTEKLDPRSRSILQAVLGSDPSREVWNLFKINDSLEINILLFETPKGAKKVERWRSIFLAKAAAEYVADALGV